jgi:hypothetical protein
MENTPATLKTSENARKYHFLPRKSMLGLAEEIYVGIAKKFHAA